MISDDRELLELQIIPGAVVVNSGAAVHKADDIVCISLDLKSKYADLLCWGSSDDIPCVSYVANDVTMYLDKSMDGDAITEVSFPDYAGWEVFSASAPGRYTANVVLVKRG